MEMSHSRSHTEEKHSAGRIKWTGKRSWLELSTEITTQWGAKYTKCSVSGCNVPVHGLLNILISAEKQSNSNTKQTCYCFYTFQLNTDFSNLKIDMDIEHRCQS